MKKVLKMFSLSLLLSPSLALFIPQVWIQEIRFHQFKAVNFFFFAEAQLLTRQLEGPKCRMHHCR